MQIVPVFREDSTPLGHFQVGTHGVTYLKKHKELVFVPWYDDHGRLTSVRVLEEKDYLAEQIEKAKTPSLETVFDKGFCMNKEVDHV